MDLPKFLIADNSDLEEAIFVAHTEYPRFMTRKWKILIKRWKNFLL